MLGTAGKSKDELISNILYGFLNIATHVLAYQQILTSALGKHWI